MNMKTIKDSWVRIDEEIEVLKKKRKMKLSIDSSKRKKSSVSTVTIDYLSECETEKYVVEDEKRYFVYRN